MELKSGFKQTEIGLLPEDWQVRTVDGLGLVTSGKRLPRGTALVDDPTPHPYIRVTDMRPGTVSLAELKFVPEAVAPAISRYRIFEGDIFVSVAGTLGIVGRVPAQLHGANLTENADRITNLTCSQGFLLHILASPLIQRAIDSIRTVGAQPKLALSRLRKFVVPLPPRSEQDSIAAALDDADALLDGLTRLIAKKRDLKQAAMQQLLTGRTRLPGFFAEWLPTPLGDLVEIQKGQLMTSAARVEGPIPVVAGGQSPAYYHNVANRHGRTITISASGAYAGYVGRYDVPIFASDCSTISEGAGYDLDFIYYQLVLKQRAIYNVQVGGAQPHVHPADLSPIVVSVPPVEEQSAIAAVLSDMDAELAALEARRAKTQALKQAMMQALLTGRIRLVSPEPAHA